MDNLANLVLAEMARNGGAAATWSAVIDLSGDLRGALSERRPMSFKGP